MPDNPRKCPICHTGELEPGQTTSTFTKGETTLVVKEVPALVCETCGEAYLASDVTKELLSQAREAVKEGADIKVRKYEGPSADT